MTFISQDREQGSQKGEEEKEKRKKKKKKKKRGKKEKETGVKSVEQTPPWKNGHGDVAATDNDVYSSHGARPSKDVYEHVSVSAAVRRESQ